MSGYFSNKAEKLFGTANISIKEAAKQADTLQKRVLCLGVAYEATKMCKLSKKDTQEVFKSIRKLFPPCKDPIPGEHKETPNA